MVKCVREEAKNALLLTHDAHARQRIYQTLKYLFYFFHEILLTHLSLLAFEKKVVNIDSYIERRAKKSRITKLISIFQTVLNLFNVFLYCKMNDVPHVI